jgi:hypothetical protein
VLVGVDQRPGRYFNDAPVPRRKQHDHSILQYVNVPAFVLPTLPRLTPTARALGLFDFMVMGAGQSARPWPAMARLPLHMLFV